MSLNTYEDFEEWCTNTHHDPKLETSWDEFLRTSMDTRSKVQYYLELGQEVQQLEQQMGMPLEKIEDAYQKLLKQDRRKGDFIEKHYGNVSLEWEK